MSEHKSTDATDKFTPTERTKVRRKPDRAHYERQTIYDILDQAFVCHVAFIADGMPFVVPTNYVRVGDRLYLHGSPASRLMKALSSGAPFCLSVTLLDGIVFAPTAMGHSVNYRSVVVIGKAEVIQDPGAKTKAMRDFVDYVARGRWAAVRPPTAQEVAATMILAVPLVEASAKIRTGFAVDNAEEYASGAWTGVLPFKWTPGEPIRDPRGNASVPVPSNIQRYSRPQ
jgi:nitroimidazol reductase NimA-like FMN-containing flavoprotein (pyridoxamine 5'-phosphate oxidase superfamily)